MKKLIGIALVVAAALGAAWVGAKKRLEIEGRHDG